MNRFVPYKIEEDDEHSNIALLSTGNRFLTWDIPASGLLQNWKPHKQVGRICSADYVTIYFEDMFDLEQIRTSIDESLGELKIIDLGWSESESLETRLRLSSFAEDWDAPGMEAYDAL